MFGSEYDWMFLFDEKGNKLPIKMFESEMNYAFIMRTIERIEISRA